jgi:hypothetical protein
MNSDVKQKWVEALRSGKYKQGTGALRDSDGMYCCLGVLCELAVEAGAASRTNSGTYGVRDEEGYMIDGSDSVLPQSVSVWAGLHGAANPMVVFGTNHASLADLNDNVGLSFERIADVIEEQL